MDFLIQWLCYLLAFVAGSAVARMIAGRLIHRTGDDEAGIDVPGPGVGAGQ